MSNVRAMVALPYGFCHSMLNLVRQEQYACKSGHSTMGPFMMIFGGLLVLGVGRTMPFSLGLPLMDDNVKKQNLPLYFCECFDRVTENDKVVFSIHVFCQNSWSSHRIAGWRAIEQVVCRLQS